MNDPDRRSLLTAVALSAALHAGLALVPGPPDAEPPGGVVRPVDFLLEEPAALPEPAPAAHPPAAESPPPVPDAMGPFVPPSAAGPSLTDAWAPAASGSGASAPASGAAEPRPETYRPPRLLVGALPLSDEEWDALGADGEIAVPVRLRVARDGTVDRVEPDDAALDPRLFQAVDRSAAAMRFVPASLDGRPVEAWFTMTFVYRRGS